VALNLCKPLLLKSIAQSTISQTAINPMHMRAIALGYVFSSSIWRSQYMIRTLLKSTGHESTEKLFAAKDVIRQKGI
jgi:hypothetical protein